MPKAEKKRWVFWEQVKVLKVWWEKKGGNWKVYIFLNAEGNLQTKKSGVIWGQLKAWLKSLLFIFILMLKATHKLKKGECWGQWKVCEKKGRRQLKGELYFFECQRQPADWEERGATESVWEKKEGGNWKGNYIFFWMLKATHGLRKKEGGNWKGNYTFLSAEGNPWTKKKMSVLGTTEGVWEKREQGTWGVEKKRKCGKKMEDNWVYFFNAEGNLWTKRKRVNFWDTVVFVSRTKGLTT